jgi:hypothetical protein
MSGIVEADGRTAAPGRQRRAVQVYVTLTEKTIDAPIWSAIHKEHAISDVLQWRN